MDATWLNVWLQSLGEWLIIPTQFFTFLGYEQFYLIFIPIIFWCFDPGTGLRLGIGLMISAGVNSVLKLIIHGPRPYWVDPRVQAYSTETSFGAPSGHAQNGAVFWGLLANRLQKPAAWAAASLIITFIGISRIYLGVHFFADVVFGWLVGGLWFWMMIRFEKPFLGWFNQRKAFQQVMIGFGVSLGMIAAAAAARSGIGDWSLPSGWYELSSRFHSTDPVNPLQLTDAISSAATLFGMVLGVVLLRKRGWLDPSGSFWQRAARSLLGLAGALLIWYGLKQVFPEGDALIPYGFRYLRYGLLGLWTTYLAPILFFQLKLADAETQLS